MSAGGGANLNLRTDRLPQDSYCTAPKRKLSWISPGFSKLEPLCSQLFWWLLHDKIALWHLIRLPRPLAAGAVAIIGGAACVIGKTIT
jgi:hypothetical protein